MRLPDKNILYLIDYFIFTKKVKTQGEFCRSIGMLQPTISKIISGKSHFTVIQIENICNIYRINANWIFGLENNMFLESKPQNTQAIKCNIADNVKRQ